MNVYLKSAFAATMLLAAAVCAAKAPAREGRPAASESAETADEKVAITAVLSSYAAALNASSIDAVMPLYAEDGVFMEPYSRSAVGTAAVRKAYEATFKAIKLSVKFHVVEVVEMGPDWAFARTNSAGTVTRASAH